MKVKRILSVALALVLVASSAAILSSCGESGKYKVGICQLVQHDALDAATKGFKDYLTEKLGDKVTFDEQNAAGETANCATIVNQFVSSNYNLILANATPALQAAATATETIPVVGTSITDYATALNIKDWKGSTGTNVTGSCDLAPLDQQAAMIKEVMPNIKNVGILYCSAEANSKYQANVISEELKKLGINSTEYTFADSNDLQSVLQGAIKNCEALYVPTDNTVASNTGIIENICAPAKIPVFAGEENICKGCGVVTLSISYEDIGRKAGELAYDILVNGKKAGDLPVTFAKDLEKKVVKSRADALKITVPEGYKEISAEKAE